MRRKLFLGILVLLIILLCSSAFAGSSIFSTIDVIYKNISIYVNEEPLESDVEPFVIEDKGVTMVPVRAVSEALGMNVNWDEETNSIFIGTAEKPGPAPGEYIPGHKYWSNKPTADIENLNVLRNVGPFYEKQDPIMIASRSFHSGLAVEVDTDRNAETVLDLYGNFSTIEGYYGVEDISRNSSAAVVIKFYGDGRLLYETRKIEPSDYPSWLPAGKIDLRGVNRLKIEVVWHETENEGDYSEITAALGNFKLYRR